MKQSDTKVWVLNYNLVLIPTKQPSSLLIFIQGKMFDDANIVFFAKKRKKS